MNSEAFGQIAEIENSIIDRLRPLLKDFNVEAYPDNPDSYDLKHNKGAVLVSLKSKNRINDSESFCGYKESFCYFNVFILCRHLRAKDAHQGIYDALEIAEHALDDWQPELDNCDCFEFMQGGFISKGENVFIYGALFKILVRG